MEASKLNEEIDCLLRSLRKCDTQATAVAWMTRAHKALEQSLEYINKPDPAASRIVFMTRPQEIQIVQSVSAFDLHAAQARRAELQAKSGGETVVYPDLYLHPGLKPRPKAWTREDTLRLERAAKTGAGAPNRQGGRGRG